MTPVPKPTTDGPNFVNFEMKHLEYAMMNHILTETGYTRLTDFETSARYYNLFVVPFTASGYIEYNGKVGYPIDYFGNEDCFHTFEIGVGHLRNDIAMRIMKDHIGMSQIDYEMYHAHNNTIYMVVPYKTCLDTLYERYQEWEQQTYDEEVAAANTLVQMRNNYETDESEDEITSESDVETESEDNETESEDESESDVETVVVPTPQSRPLEGWDFELNSTTQNSYILTSTKDKTSTTPKSWNLGFGRPVFYNPKYQGWIVSLKNRDDLLRLGAREIVPMDVDEESDVSSVESVETPLLQGWEYSLNQKTRNSYVLKPMGFRKNEEPTNYAPTTWDLGFERPVYYSTKYMGWIVSKRNETDLVKMGALPAGKV